ncbi:MAG TPA: NAD(P)/FAD-dependent oxidoreductase [Novosphingobium sp.]|nr:NAD(P)/FAD-dependent oxidoreductase [Novosphingobium sp.]
MSRKIKIVVIGAGMAGILSALKLKERDDAEFVVYEKANAVSGTWLYNRYPGLTCDVPAHAYTYSFAPNPEWSSVYAPGDEIRRYFEGIADRFDVRRFIELGVEVKTCDWTGEEWSLTLSDGRTVKADVVIAASGVLHHPNIPQIAGMETFKGRIFHSAQWDDEAKLDGARVGVIGCGSTGVQIVSALSTRASNLVHFCRTPQWIMPIRQRLYSDEEKAGFRADTRNIEAIRYGDKYQGVLTRFEAAVTNPSSEEMAEIEKIVTDNLEASVRDPELREKLRPNYRAACKRLIFSGDYYESVQRPNVVVDTGAIERIEPNGIRMKNGQFYELDAIVLATGFAVDRFVRPMRITGANGTQLDDVWSKHPSAYYAISVPHFPNFFMINGPSGPVGNFSLIDVAEAQWHYIEQLIDVIAQNRARSVEVTPSAMEAFETWRANEALKTVWATGCSSWYLDEKGIPNTWPKGLSEFKAAMAAPRMEDYQLNA